MRLLSVQKSSDAISEESFQVNMAIMEISAGGVKARDGRRFQDNYTGKINRSGGDFPGTTRRNRKIRSLGMQNFQYF